MVDTPAYHSVSQTSADDYDEDIELSQGSKEYPRPHHASFGVSRPPRTKAQLLRIFGFSLLALFVVIASFDAGRSSARTAPSLPANVVNEVDTLDKTDGLEPVLGPMLDREDGFTIMVPSYKRPQILPGFLDTFASGGIPSLKRIVVMWHDNTTEPPQSVVDSLASYKVPIVIEKRDRPLNERFRRSDNIKTNCVLAIDDDMIYKPTDVEMGYQVWKAFGQGRTRMVGYIKRAASKEGKYLIRIRKKAYSMVLTKTAFFHIDWLDAYWSPDERMTTLRDYVTEYRNCEDILMSFLVARHTRVPPIAVEATSQDKGNDKGISTEPGHMDERSACVRRFKEAFGDDTLVSTTLSVKNVSY